MPLTSTCVLKLQNTKNYVKIISKTANSIKYNLQYIDIIYK